MYGDMNRTFATYSCFMLSSKPISVVIRARLHLIQQAHKNKLKEFMANWNTFMQVRQFHARSTNVLQSDHLELASAGFYWNREHLLLSNTRNVYQSKSKFKSLNPALSSFESEYLHFRPTNVHFQHDSVFCFPYSEIHHVWLNVAQKFFLEFFVIRHDVQVGFHQMLSCGRQNSIS